MADEQFSCAQCGGTFDKGWSDEEAEAEAMGLWGEISSVVVCDDCFQQMTAAIAPESFRTLSAELADLERTDPAVREAAENYDRMVARVLGRPQGQTGRSVR